jgi:hypothetical protein
MSKRGTGVSRTLVAAEFTSLPGQNTIVGVSWSGIYRLANTPLPDWFGVEFFAAGGKPNQPLPFLRLDMGSPGRTLIEA